jgi:REP element-mobilizing transposase RayT
MSRTPRQLELRIRTWGGRRRGAGRKPAPGRRSTPHRRRAPHNPSCPVHVTPRRRSGLPTLRGNLIFSAIQRAFRAASRDSFRLLQFSVQSDHLHLVVEADTPTRLTRGVQGLAIRVARAINRATQRSGRVWDGRYHAHSLRTPREVRNALVYVLQNVRKHVRRATGLDPCSSARWFRGWRRVVAAPLAGAPVVAARTWLARIGWRRHGLLHLGEMPRGRSRFRSSSPAPHTTSA